VAATFSERLLPLLVFSAISPMPFLPVSALSFSFYFTLFISHNKIVLPVDSAFWALICVLFFCCTVATFVSHTVASLILMPIITSIGTSFNIPEPMVIGAAFASKLIRFTNSFVVHFFLVSGAMGLPFSSFPNVNSLLIVDDFQRPYLSVQDFLKSGMLLTAITIFLISTVGYLLISFVLIDKPRITPM
jgi:phosphate transporter